MAINVRYAVNSLIHTIESGQIFRYRQEQDSFRIIHGQDSFKLSLNDGTIIASGISKAKLNTFLRNDDDYSSILKNLPTNPPLCAAITKFNGMRLLRQDPWECTISFLCSTATNIPRIKRDLNNIAQTFGEEKEGIFLFPKIGEIDSEEKIRRCGTGFRAKYIHAVNSIVTRSFFNKLRKLPYGDAKADLMQLPGIGPKVADCILLFSCDHLSAFPIDTWMKKVLQEDYLRKEKSYAQLSQWAGSYFGKNAGYAQQFLYHWKRTR